MTEEINNAIEVLANGGLILYPTDTVWCVGCDATNEVAVQKIIDLKQPLRISALICLVANDGMLERHITNVPDLAYDIMDLSTKPTTIIYEEPKGIAQNLIAPNNTVPVRVASDKFCQYLINKFKKPLVAAAAHISGKASPKNFGQISPVILKEMQYVVTLQQDVQKENTSALIKLSTDGKVKVIRA